jgi:acyl carrier protein/DNA-directed RNA polymerase specialized sigma24 family protein
LTIIAMAKEMFDERILSLPPEIVEASRSGECRPSGVLALAQGRKLPRGHHARGCLACRYDAIQLRQQFAITEPAVSLSMLFATRWEAMTDADGVSVQFSDRSRARVRATIGADAIEIVVDQVRVTGRMQVAEMVIEVRRSELPDEDAYQRQFVMLARKRYTVMIPQEEFENPDARFLIRMRKVAMTSIVPLPGRAMGRESGGGDEEICCSAFNSIILDGCGSGFISLYAHLTALPTAPAKPSNNRQIIVTKSEVVCPTTDSFDVPRPRKLAAGTTYYWQAQAATTESGEFGLCSQIQPRTTALLSNYVLTITVDGIAGEIDRNVTPIPNRVDRNSAIVPTKTTWDSVHAYIVLSDLHTATAEGRITTPSDRVLKRLQDEIDEGSRDQRNVATTRRPDVRASASATLPFAEFTINQNVVTRGDRLDFMVRACEDNWGRLDFFADLNGNGEFDDATDIQLGRFRGQYTDWRGQIGTRELAPGTYDICARLLAFDGQFVTSAPVTLTVEPEVALPTPARSATLSINPKDVLVLVPHRNGDVAVAPDGSFVVAWNCFFRHFDASGNPLSDATPFTSENHLFNVRVATSGVYVHAVDDAILDGNQTVAASVSSDGYVSGSTVVEDTDYEEIRFYGPGGNDVFDVTMTPESFQVTVTSAQSVLHRARVKEIHFHGALGTDSAAVSGITAAQSAIPEKCALDMRGSNYVITANYGGSDRLFFCDSRGRDEFKARGAFSDGFIQGSSFYNYASGFHRYFAFATTSATDHVYFYDSPGNDAFTARGPNAYLSGTGFYHYARYFDKKYAYATAGSADDRAYFYDSAGNDVFTARGPANGAYFTGAAIYHYAHYFDKNYAYATAGGADERAYFYDAAGGDVFNARGATNDADLTGACFYHYAPDFDTHHVYATAGGADDRAYFDDTTRNDVFTSRGQINKAYLASDAIFHYARYFDKNYAYATDMSVAQDFQDNPDIAVFHNRFESSYYRLAGEFTAFASPYGGDSEVFVDPNVEYWANGEFSVLSVAEFENPGARLLTRMGEVVIALPGQQCGTSLRDMDVFFERAQPKLLLWLRTQSFNDPEDFAQDIWLEMVRRLGQSDFDEESRMFAWLWRIAREHLFEVRKGGRHESGLSPQANGEFLGIPDRRLALADDLISRVYRALDPIQATNENSKEDPKTLIQQNSEKRDIGSQQVEGYIRRHISERLYIPMEKVDVNHPLNNLGIDSLNAVELLNDIENRFGVRLPLDLLLEGPTIGQLADRILGQLDVDHAGLQQDSESSMPKTVIRGIATNQGENDFEVLLARASKERQLREVNRVNRIIAEQFDRLAKLDFQLIAEVDLRAGFVTNDDLSQVLVSGLLHDNSDIRMIAVTMLETIGARAQTAVPALVAKVKDKRTRDRHILILMLGRIGAKQAVPALIEALEDEDPFICDHAIAALRNILEDFNSVPGLETLVRQKKEMLNAISRPLALSHASP